ncbi:FAD-dependent oxidoreductase [Variovorax sp. LjRoot130]|uniref:FAD-dependent oxidoreductase n=1 Tax=Variovorax sp. LjRoot130 TaxID=3342261 RepID=UPI003ECD0F5B
MVVDHASGELSLGISGGRSAAGALVRRIVVVGGGITGLTCALACARAGAHVEVIEAHASATRLPAHIDVVPNLLRDLARLGVAQACVQRGFAYSGLSVVDERGDEGFRLPTPSLAGPQLPPAVGIALADLLDLLEGAAVRSSVDVHRGCTVSRVDSESGRVIAEDGRVWEADLVLIAAGAGSPLASALLGPARPGVLRHAWWHALLPRPPWLDRSTWMAGSVGRRLLLVPISMSRAGVAVVSTEEASGPTDGYALTRQLKSWGSFPRRIAAAIDPSAPVVLHRVTSWLRDPPWHRGAVLCVGASAHVIAPPFGQSAAQDLEDAVVLGELAAAGLDRPRLLRQFTERRSERVRCLHELTERAALWTTQPEPATDLLQLAGEIDRLVATPA